LPFYLFAQLDYLKEESEFLGVDGSKWIFDSKYKAAWSYGPERRAMSREFSYPQFLCHYFKDPHHYADMIEAQESQHLGMIVA
jgi:hypothetical protein